MTLLDLLGKPWLYYGLLCLFALGVFFFSLSRAASRSDDVDPPEDGQ
ncbi:hypothetical protein [Pseudacidovorax intermedius]|nr:hypothetical protein [Pseudacidovorax intermedius]